MPTPVLDKDALTIAELILKWIITPLCAMVVSLGIWAWKSKEKSQDKLEEALTNHIRNDEDVHDKLFTELRAQGKDVRELQTNASNIKDSLVTHHQMFKSVAEELDECRNNITKISQKQEDCNSCP